VKAPSLPLLTLFLTSPLVSCAAESVCQRQRGWGVERGETIAGRYELVERLGRGAMGEVWAGRDCTLHRDVAIKVLVPDSAAFQELSWRFEREAVAAAQISHPNVVTLYDRGVHEDVLFLVMEKVEGATLAEHIRDRSPMGLTRALTIAQGICAALIAAHRAGVIHYDIKPDNVMLTPGGQVKVVDFGIAGFIQTAFALARSSQLTPAGTVEYGAPEQFLTERGDERSDLYALGSVLFTLLVGQPPFTGHNVIGILRRKLDEDAPRIDSLRPHLPPALTTLVAELLDRDPARRPSSARQAQERISRLQTALAARDGGAAEPREVLLAKAADVMKALLANKATLLTAPPMRPILQSPQSPAKTGVQTRRLPGLPQPFHMSWTGTEPPATYAASRDADKHSYWLWSALWSPLAAASIYFPLQHTRSDDSPWGLILVLGFISAFIAVCCIIQAAGDTLEQSKEARRRPEKPAWTLHVGPQYIVTAGSNGRREFAWDQIQSVTIEEIKGSSPYRYTGVHVQLAPGVSRPPKIPPAGWPHPEPNTITILANGRVPVCVLGPMTGQQRIELTEALARYGDGQWRPPTA
jgi:serine/threonine protein kinase